MSDELQQRISRAMYEGNAFGWSRYMCDEAAYEVVRELGLRQEWTVEITYHQSRASRDRHERLCHAGRSGGAGRDRLMHISGRISVESSEDRCEGRSGVGSALQPRLRPRPGRG